MQTSKKRNTYIISLLFFTMNEVKKFAEDHILNQWTAWRMTWGVGLGIPIELILGNSGLLGLGLPIGLVIFILH